MTLIIGILCEDGVVMASDSAATFGTVIQPTIGQQQVQKVQRINDQILYSSSGAIGISQLISDLIRRSWEDKTFSNQPSPEALMNKIGCSIGGLLQPYFQNATAQRALVGEAGMSLCKSLVAVPVKGQANLFQFDYNGAPERATRDLPFVALGSGCNIADPFLALLRRLLWSKREPTVSEGRLAAVWAVEHTRKTNPGGVGGDIQLATLARIQSESPKVIMASRQDIEEHLERISTAETVLVSELRGGNQQTVPPIPTSLGTNQNS